MEKSKFTIDEIHIGDEVLFKDAHPVQHNLFWRVIHKLSRNRLIVEIREMGYAEKYIVYVKDVINLEKNYLAF
ncbi:MAG: hypothetical protein H7Z13_11130 [Ferruginibacter sp.]|nr:hypothetical protein [Ferruginibacter sp.]